MIALLTVVLCVVHVHYVCVLISLPLGAMGWSMICDFGLLWSSSLVVSAIFLGDHSMTLLAKSY